MLRVNAFIVESANELVIVDTTLTASDSKALKKKADALGKPISGILLTHGHPDHVAGTYHVAPNGEVPIYALQSVHDLMKATEQSKHQQWSAMFGDEWIPKWVYPNHIVNDRDTVTIGALSFTVVDLGAGGDCDANSIWLLENERQAAFVGDFLYRRNHTYMADGSVLRWLANLERFKDLLSGYDAYYVGHGPTGDVSALAEQQEYMLASIRTLLEVTQGSAVLTDESRKKYEEVMLAKYPDYGFQFAVGLSADALARELSGAQNYPR